VRPPAPAPRAATPAGTPIAEVLYVDPVKLALQRRRQHLLG
jgi:hypothetical protein